jgi:hypothetical protein
VKLSLPDKLGSHLFIFVKFPDPHLMPHDAETGRSWPPNRLTLRITLISACFPNVQKDRSIMCIEVWSKVQNPFQIYFFKNNTNNHEHGT